MISTFACSSTAIAKLYFWRGDRALGAGHWALGAGRLSPPNFSYVSNFPKILSRKSFENSQDNFYAKLDILHIRFHLTCGESDLY